MRSIPEPSCQAQTESSGTVPLPIQTAPWALLLLPLCSDVEFLLRMLGAGRKGSRRRQLLQTMFPCGLPVRASPVAASKRRTRQARLAGGDPEREDPEGPLHTRLHCCCADYRFEN